MWWIVIAGGIVLATIWICYIIKAKNYDNRLKLYSKTRWTLRPFVPVFLVPEMLRAWKFRNWEKFILYAMVNLACAATNIVIFLFLIAMAMIVIMSFLYSL